MTLAVDKTPLPGKAKSKRGSKRKAAPASTPDAAAALAETPVAETLDFTFKNAWLARVTQGFSREDILDLAMSTMRPYADAKEAGVKLPTVPGGYESLSLEKFDGVVAMLESLADFGKWDHTSDKPDLPAEYPVAPSLSHACMALGCGLERIEIAYNAKLPGKSKKKVDLTAGLLKKLGGKFDSVDQFSQDVLSAMAQEGRIWQSDGGRVTPFRLEFYMRSKDITQSILTKVFDMATSPSWRDFYSECEGMDAQAKWIIANAVKKASEATAAAVERRLKAEQARKAKAAAAAKAASGAGAGYADAASLAARSAAAGAEDMDAEDDASDSNRSALSAAESARSHLTDMSVRSVLSAVGSVRSTRSVLTDVSDAMRKDGSIRASVDKVKMHDALDLQKTQFGRPGLTMSLTEANAAAECAHRRWVFDDNLVIDIRNGSMVWLTPIDSTFENGSPWWTCSQLGNPGAPHEQWNALQMVWGMEAFRKENEGTLVRPEDVEKRVRSELAKLDGGTKADGGEDLSGKTFTPTQKSLFRKLNELAQAGIDDGASGFMKHIGFDKLDSGEAVTLIRTRVHDRVPVQASATYPRVVTREVPIELQPSPWWSGSDAFPSGRSSLLRVVQNGPHSQWSRAGVHDGHIYGGARAGPARADAPGGRELLCHEADDVARRWRAHSARAAGSDEDHQAPNHRGGASVGGAGEHQGHALRRAPSGVRDTDAPVR